MTISFDEAKRAVTLSNRGLDFADAARVFFGAVLEYEDDRFDYGEVRTISVGLLYGTVIVLVWTDRGEARHIISMREDPDDVPELGPEWFDKATLKVNGKPVIGKEQPQKPAEGQATRSGHGHRDVA